MHCEVLFKLSLLPPHLQTASATVGFWLFHLTSCLLWLAFKCVESLIPLRAKQMWVIVTLFSHKYHGHLQHKWLHLTLKKCLLKVSQRCYLCENQLKRVWKVFIFFYMCWWLNFLSFCLLHFVVLHLPLRLSSSLVDYSVHLSEETKLYSIHPINFQLLINACFRLMECF